jgi:hypothetical protein
MTAYPGTNHFYNPEMTTFTNNWVAQIQLQYHILDQTIFHSQSVLYSCMRIHLDVIIIIYLSAETMEMIPLSWENITIILILYAAETTMYANSVSIN